MNNQQIVRCGELLVQYKLLLLGIESSPLYTGSGIDQVELSRIFERFYQADKSRAGVKGRGSGLGLPIASEIVNAHGGTITVNSEPGQGSVFMVKIPLVNPEQTSTRNHGSR